ncbi:MAG: transposase [bacterium]
MARPSRRSHRRRRLLARQASELRAELDHTLRPRRLKNRDNHRIVGELAWHNRRGSLLRFLDDPAVEPTNNSAERGLRVAVIARKVSHCSHNARGTNAYATLKTIAVTARQRGIEP